MSNILSNTNELKDFIRKRTYEVWEERKTPLYLSVLGKELNNDHKEYKNILNGSNLLSWSKEQDFHEFGIKFYHSIYIKEKVGFIPAGETYNDTKLSNRDNKIPLISFVKSLEGLPDNSLSSFMVPANILIDLLNKK